VTSTPDDLTAFYDVLDRQRACRVFRPDAVPDDVIARILAAAVRAPSAENSQPWRFVVVTDPDQRAKIARVAAKVWEGGAREHSAPHLTEALLADVDASMRAGGMATAPALVVVCADTTATFPTALESSIWPCVQNLLLAATAEGLGSALTTMAALAPGALPSILDLPDGVTAMAVVPLGYPARPLGRSRRRAAPEVTFRDRWGG
jgi:nitroreductase